MSAQKSVFNSSCVVYIWLYSQHQYTQYKYVVFIKRDGQAQVTVLFKAIRSMLFKNLTPYRGAECLKLHLWCKKKKKKLAVKMVP